MFQFRLDRFRTISITGALGPVWRAGIDALLAGRTFDRVTLDLVTRASETQRVEPLRLPGTLDFAGVPTVEILAVDLQQHFAEKLHGMLVPHGERPSSRVKDLADLVLFIGQGLEPSADLASVVREVFAGRGSPAPPPDLPGPADGWEARYAELATDLGLADATVAAAMSTLREFWARVLTAERVTGGKARTALLAQGRELGTGGRIRWTRDELHER